MLPRKIWCGTAVGDPNTVTVLLSAPGKPTIIVELCTEPSAELDAEYSVQLPVLLPSTIHTEGWSVDPNVHVMVSTAQCGKG